VVAAAVVGPQDREEDAAMGNKTKINNDYYDQGGIVTLELPPRLHPRAGFQEARGLQRNAVTQSTASRQPMLVLCCAINLIFFLLKCDEQPDGTAAGVRHQDQPTGAR